MDRSRGLKSTKSSLVGSMVFSWDGVSEVSEERGYCPGDWFVCTGCTSGCSSKGANMDSHHGQALMDWMTPASRKGSRREEMRAGRCAESG